MSATTTEPDPTDQQPLVAGRRARALRHVLDSFDLQTVAQVDDRWTSRFETSTSGAGRLFGGMSLAAAYLGAQSTVPSGHRLHWMSAVFLLPGRTEEALEVRAEPLRHGRSFSSIESEVVQRGRSILRATSTFRSTRGSSGARQGIEHQFAEMPDAPPPDSCPDRETRRIREYGPTWLEHPVNAVEVRVTDPSHLRAEIEAPPRAVNWVRVPGARDLPHHLRVALLLYATDRALISTAALPHGILWTRSVAATLDHSIWLHRDPRPDEWHLFVAESSIATDGLALIRLEVFDGSGVLVATCEQGGLVQSRAT